MKICIDAGHGGYDPGAVNGSHREADYALAIAKKTGELLEKHGFTVFYTRLTDSFVPLGARSGRANYGKADLFVSVHLNSAVSKKARGAEMLIYGRGGEAEKLADCIQSELVTAAGTLNRGVKTQNIAVLRQTNMPAVLVEVGFISNDEECARLATDEYQSKAAEAICRGICRYSGTEAKKGEIAMIYNYIDDNMPEWAREAVQWAVNSKVIQGNWDGLNLTDGDLRYITWLYRAVNLKAE